MFPTDKLYFELLAYAKDQKQKKNILKFTNKSQYKVIQNITKKLLNGDIQLKNIQFCILKNKKLFLRKLSQGKIKIKDLHREFYIVCYIVKLGLEHYETHSKIGTHTYRKVGKNRRQYASERSVSEISSSEECSEEHFSSEEDEDTSVSGEESEKSTRFGKNSDVSFSQSREEEESSEIV